MTSWPWMKGISTAIADPVPLVNDHDKRPAVKDLLRQHSHAIEEIRKGLAQDVHYDASKHDDLWILRFHLSHSRKRKHAIEAAKRTLAFRHLRKLDEDDIRPYPPGNGTNVKGVALKEYLDQCGEDAVTFCVTDPQRGVVAFLRPASIDQSKLIKTFPKEHWLAAALYMSEWSHQWVDYLTRTTGRLTKSVRLVDAQDVTKSTNREHQRRDGKTATLMEDCYPQLLHGIYLCDAPAWIHIPFRLIRPLLPKRIVEKIDFVCPRKNAKERKKFLHHISEDHLPVRFGGKNEEWPVNFALPTI